MSFFTYSLIVRYRSGLNILLFLDLFDFSGDDVEAMNYDLRVDSQNVSVCPREHVFVLLEEFHESGLELHG